MNWKRPAILFVAMFVGYTLFNPYLSTAIGATAGQYTAAASAGLLAVATDFVMKRVWKKE